MPKGKQLIGDKKRKLFSKKTSDVCYRIYQNTIFVTETKVLIHANKKTYSN